jgi:hypothetical protein
MSSIFGQLHSDLQDIALFSFSRCLAVKQTVRAVELLRCAPLLAPY